MAIWGVIMGDLEARIADEFVLSKPVGFVQIENGGTIK
jgi:hypothetical protein